MRNNILYCISYCISYCFYLLCIVIGCDRGPSDLPKLYPVTASVVMNGEPVDGALVACYPEDDGKWFAGGMTDPRGEVAFHTQGIYNGIPLGRYKVIVMKSRETPDSQPERYKAVRIVHSRFEDRETTPLTCVIEKNTKNIVLEVEPAPAGEIIRD